VILGIEWGEGGYPQDYYCHTCEIASGDHDIRYYFGASTIWKVPVGHRHTFLAPIRGSQISFSADGN
jgi:hypothetical protein